MSLDIPVTSKKEMPPEQEQAPQDRAGAKDHVLAFLAACGIIGPVWFTIAMIVAGLLYPSYNQLTQSTSALGSTGAPPAAASAMNYGGALAFGLFMVAFAFGLYRGVRHSRWLLTGTVLVALFGLVCIIQPFFPMDPGAASLSWQKMMHGAVFVISGVALIPGLLVLSVAFARDPNLRPYRWYTLITPVLILLTRLDVGIFPAGVPERLSSLMILIWFEVVAFRLLRLAFHREPGPGT